MHAVIDVPDSLHASSADFWARTLGWPLGDAWPNHPDLRSFEPPDGEAYVHLQRIGGPARVHVDVESTQPNSTIDQATSAGAEVVHVSDRWVSLRSPGGLPFCIVHARTHAAPEPVLWPEGHRTRMVQVCIDSPATTHDAEVTFWRHLLSGRWADSPAQEFAGKWHDDAGSPIQLLFQRLDEPAGLVRAHLDLGTDGQTAEVHRLLTFGAEDLGAGPGGWHVLRDPAGLAFCVTENRPDRTRLRDLG